MIKTKLLLIATVATSILVPAAVRAQGISIELGDRPFYSHGARYWAGDYEMIWVPGHRTYRGWVHGHYVRGQHRHQFNTRFDNRRFDDGRDRQEDRREEFRDSTRR
jgi:hypothetical protein